MSSHSRLALADATERYTPSVHTAVPGPRPLGVLRRVVVKLGTRVLVDDAGAARLDRLVDLARSVRCLRDAGREVIVVSSGAVGLGQGLLGLGATPLTPETRRACAAVGQGRLASLYESVFLDEGLLTGQVLLTDGHVQGLRGLQGPELRATFESLLAAGVVPVVNENDAIRAEAPARRGLHARRGSFEDNDGLSALVAACCDADLLLLLTDVAGVFADDPRRAPDAPLLDRVDDAEPLLARLAGADDDALSRGGMRSKVRAASTAAARGCAAVIAGSDLPCSLVERLVAGESLGTYFPAAVSAPVSTTAGAPVSAPVSATASSSSPSSSPSSHGPHGNHS